MAANRAIGAEIKAVSSAAIRVEPGNAVTRRASNEIEPTANQNFAVQPHNQGTNPIIGAGV